MKYADIIKNDVCNGKGVCVSIWLQGCPIHCPGCFNKELWDFDGGKEFTVETIEEIKTALFANGVHRNFCILGGEPLCGENLFLTRMLIEEVKKASPSSKIYVWTGYVLEDLKMRNSNPHLAYILDNIDTLIDGPFVQELKDITLPMRGSSNQRIIDLKN